MFLIQQIMFAPYLNFNMHLFYLVPVFLSLRNNTRFMHLYVFLLYIAVYFYFLLVFL